MSNVVRGLCLRRTGDVACDYISGEDGSAVKGVGGDEKGSDPDGRMPNLGYRDISEIERFKYVLETVEGLLF